MTERPAMERPVLTFAIVILLIAMGAAALVGVQAQAGAARQSWSQESTPPWLSPVQAMQPPTGRAYTTSALGERGTALAPLSISSSANFEPGSTIKVCLDGQACSNPAYRVIRSVAGADLVLNSPVTLVTAASPVVGVVTQTDPR